MKIKKSKLKEFIKNAKENTFANKETTPVESSRKNSVDFRYEKDNFVYRDSFLGEIKDIGEEVVWYNGKPIWGMNYRGGMIEGHEDKAEKVFNFLKKALSDVPKESPYRGPKSFSEDNLRYKNDFEGNISGFKGKEAIFESGQKIYERIYHGGIIK